MLISICIPQYNRIRYLLKSLSIIEQQQYPDIEIVISDDCSTDETYDEIQSISSTYKFPIVYHRNEHNLGYDGNLRQCMSLSSGDYCLIIGNDDSLNGDHVIQFLVEFLKSHQYPDVGFCNMIEERSGNTLVERARKSGIIGSGPDVAIKYYSCFSFVGGLIFKRSIFDKFNTSRFDGSIYVQMYFGVVIVSSGYTLFSIHEPLIIKDISIQDEYIDTYRNKIAKKWKQFRIVDAGLPSVIHVLIHALKDTGYLNQDRIKYIFFRIYALTYPHWILDYKLNKAFPEAVGLMMGMFPFRNKNFHRLNVINKIYLMCIYLIQTVFSLAIPAFLFKKYKHTLYRLFKK